MRRLNNYTTTGKSRDLFAFNSMTEITEFCNPSLFKQGRSKFVGRDDLNTWDSTSTATKTDWLHGLEVLQRFVEDLRKAEIPEVKSHKRKAGFSFEEGDEVDYDRLMSGQEFFRTVKRESTTGPTTVTIVIDTTTPASQDSDNILWRGAAAIALTILLEEKGYSVELWVVNGSSLYAGKDTKVMTSCCLKECSDPIDFSTLVNTVSGWFYRSITFTLLDTLCAHAGEKVALGYGYCAEPDQTDLDQFNSDELRIYASGVFSYNGALSLMTSELERIAEQE